MADNLVRLIVGANDADATAHLDALKLKLDEIGRKVETASVNLKGDKQAELSLARIAMRLDAVGRKTEKPEIKIEGIARAEVDLLGLDLALDRVGNKVNGGTVRGGLIGALSNLSLGLLSAGESAGTGAAGIGAILVPLAALAAIMSGPLIASLLPITAGFAAFGAGAVGEIGKVIKAHQALQAAQQAYEKATTHAGRVAALKAERLATEDLSGSEKRLMGLMDGLGRQWGKLLKAIQPQVVQAMASALGILKDVMPALRTLAVAAGNAMVEFLGNIKRWLESSSGQKFLHWMSVDGPKAIATFGKVMWAVAQAVGRTFDFLKNAGESWWKNFFILVHLFETIWSNGVRGFVQLGEHIRFAFDSMVRGFEQGGHLIASIWNSTWQDVVSVLKSAWSFISGIFSDIEGAVSSVAGALSSISGAISGVASAGSAIGGFLGHFGFAAGGIVGAASGGPRSGLTLVGERGAELVRLPPGSQVYNHGQSQQMLAGAGQGGGPVRIELVVTGSDSSIITALAKSVRVKGGDGRIFTQKVSSLV
jgi:hypothetical protein